MYTGLARKLGLIDRPIVHTAKMEDMYIGKLLIPLCTSINYMRLVRFICLDLNPVVLLLMAQEHLFMNINTGRFNEEYMTWECESIFSCAYPDAFKTLYKHLRKWIHPGTRIPNSQNVKEKKDS